MKKYQIITAVVVALLGTLAIAYAFQIEQPSSQQLAKIKMALDEGLFVGKSAAIKSSHHPNAYYIGVNFLVPDIQEEMTGIWLIGGPKDSPNLLYSVNGAAHQFSGMRKASETKAAAYVTDTESRLLLKHLNP